MEISLTIIFLMAVVFVFRARLLKKIKANNCYCDPSDNIYVAIPSIKVLEDWEAFQRRYKNLSARTGKYK